MRTYQLYANLSQANAANVQILKSGRIKSVTWVVYLDGTADNNSVTAELSFQSASQLTTNNAQGVISACTQYINVGAAGNAVTGINFQDFTDIPVQTGEIIYINTAISGSSAVKVLVHVQD